MGEERALYLNSIIDRLVNLSMLERTTALTHLYNLRTAAVEDLSDAGDDWQHWDSVLGSSTPPDNVKALIRDLTHLPDDELAIVGAQVSERSHMAQEQILHIADYKERAKLQAQLAASAKQARKSYVAARRGLDMKHKAKLAEKMKDVRDAIEHGIDTGQDITALEVVFDRIEQAFWDQCPRSAARLHISPSPRSSASVIVCKLRPDALQKHSWSDTSTQSRVGTQTGDGDGEIIAEDKRKIGELRQMLTTRLKVQGFGRRDEQETA
ncbi:uncharacterized protein M421DRAFT_96070 [Didymella exigua CBS 183.55]|uniref:Uncharacterized protein n=1 Tax=Didymella exigua CBS 183.55 TaxID=1150837 RepID=A0A6A5R717_9PLEO|nr:uncharacterized protein M421DRAFT_96070 [Didymella exigua CBS 183.55]KAF1923522.1 hypothetical protein M421DRAFT_96070 [Didymella exigua CBS 183.55]